MNYEHPSRTFRNAWKGIMNRIEAKHIEFGIIYQDVVSAENIVFAMFIDTDIGIHIRVDTQIGKSDTKHVFLVFGI